MDTASSYASTRRRRIYSRSRMARFTQRFTEWRNAAGSSPSGDSQRTIDERSFINSRTKAKKSSKPNAPTGTASLKQSPKSCRPHKMKIALPNLLMRPNHTKTEVEEELQFHIEMLERTYRQDGMPDAKAAALKRFGNLERIRKQCMHIRQSNSLLRRVLKTSSILIALTGLAIHTLNSDYKVARIGTMLIAIAVSGRLLLYLRG